jgi:hypothetical protein
MTRSRGLRHVAVSVPPGTLTDDFRAQILEFYGSEFGWVEIEALRLPDRMTLAVGRHCYVNVRERDPSMACTGYEHIGLLVESPEDADATWEQLDRDPRDLGLEPIERGDDGYRNFRFRYLLPLAIEVQFLP